jgi:hypothetical protein
MQLAGHPQHRLTQLQQSMTERCIQVKKHATQRAGATQPQPVDATHQVKAHAVARLTVRELHAAYLVTLRTRQECPRLSRVVHYQPGGSASLKRPTVHETHSQQQTTPRVPPPPHYRRPG